MNIRDIKLTDLRFLETHKDEFTDIQGFCTILSISKRTAFLWLEKGIIKSKKVGNSHYFHVQDIINLFK